MARGLASTAGGGACRLKPCAAGRVSACMVTVCEHEMRLQQSGPRAGEVRPAVGGSANLQTWTPLAGDGERRSLAAGKQAATLRSFGCPWSSAISSARIKPRPDVHPNHGMQRTGYAGR